MRLGNKKKRGLLHALSLVVPCSREVSCHMTSTLGEDSREFSEQGAAVSCQQGALTCQERSERIREVGGKERMSGNCEEGLCKLEFSHLEHPGSPC